MKRFEWNEEKNKKLKLERGIGFEAASYAITHGGLLKALKHPNQKRYPNQKLFIVKLNDYAYVVPYVEKDDKLFLKTIYPSRIHTKKFIKKGLYE